MAHPLPAQARSVYRSILRELPRHPVSRSSTSPSSSSLLSTPSPLQTRIREYISNPRSSSSSSSSSSSAAVDKTATGTGTGTGIGAAPPTQTQSRSPTATDPEPETAVQRARLEEARQFTEYVRAQGMYMELLERYNPGAEMDEQERVRLTARRVGMDLPSAMEGEEGEDGSGEGNAGR